MKLFIILFMLFTSLFATPNSWIKVWKKERKLMLMQNQKILKTYKIALSSFAPSGDKEQVGDGKTPNGRFYICESLHKNLKAKYGARSLRLSYPNKEDARRGLRDKLINKSQYKKIIKAIDKKRMPPQNTKLGSSIRIHGGGNSIDWTLGCIAMNDNDIIELYSKIKGKTRVDVYENEVEDKKLNKKNYLNREILKSAKKLMAEGCKYTQKATGIFNMSFPYGDFDKKIGVCTDLIIRALREVDIDLQSLLYEDLILHKKRYKKIKKINTNIDHRRTKNLKIWFDNYTQKVTDKNYIPGDIVVMDTGIRNGTKYDHIGIVSDTKYEGRYLVINLWSVGYDLNEMDLLNGKYPTVVGHYRFNHPFDY